MTGENRVDVDPVGLAAEADQVELPPEPSAQPGGPAAGLEPAPGAADAGAQTMEQLGAHVPEWKPGTDVIANTFADVIAPNWQLTAAERDQVSGSLALALAAWFPDDVIPIKYLVLLNVGASFWNLAASRRDPATGKIRPMRRPAPPDTAKTDTPPAPGAAPGEPSQVTTSAGGATTSTG